MRGGYGKAVDLWSLGIICYLLYTTPPPPTSNHSYLPLTPHSLLFMGCFSSTPPSIFVSLFCLCMVFRHRGGLPFDGKTKEVVVQKTLHAKLSFSNQCWKEVSKEARDLIEALLERDPERRITMESALEHPWFGHLTENERWAAFPYHNLLFPTPLTHDPIY